MNIIAKINNVRVDKGSKFCNRSMKNMARKNDAEIYSTHNERKSVVTERFIRTLKIDEFIINR